MSHTFEAPPLKFYLFPYELKVRVLCQKIHFGHNFLHLKKKKLFMHCKTLFDDIELKIA